MTGRPWLKRAGLGVLGLLAVIQLVRPARTNPPEDPRVALAANAGASPHAAAILQRSCLDCHTNRTVWPWYSNVAPVSWLLIRDVNEGRAELNFSDWGRYPPEKRGKLLRETCKEAQEGEMPPAIYLAMHPSSKLTPAEKTALCAWTEEARKGLPQAALGGDDDEDGDED